MGPGLQEFLANHNRVVATIRVPEGGDAPHPPAFDASAVARHPATGEALRVLGDDLRACGYDNTPGPGGPLARLALGYSVGRDDLRAGLADRLVGCGVAETRGPQVRLHGAILATGRTLVFIRRDGACADRVYLGSDSLLLEEAVRRLAGAGGRAVELGAGPGLVTMALAATYRAVVATDLAAGVVATALLTSALNRLPAGHSVKACVADVAAGLRPESFDFVAANTPWVPSSAAQAILYADGGPTGMELPSRFVTEGTRLLRPGGTAVFLMTDVRFGEGASPLDELRGSLAADGNWVAIVGTPFAAARRASSGVAGATSARHVATVVARPPVPAGVRSRVSELASAWADRTASP